MVVGFDVTTRYDCDVSTTPILLFMSNTLYFPAGMV